MVRSSDGKKWFYNRVLRADFPPPTTRSEPFDTMVAHGPVGSGPISGQEIWLIGGDSYNTSTRTFGPSLYYSLDSGATLSPCNGIVGPSYPRSVVFGNGRWLAYGFRLNGTAAGSPGVLWNSTNGVDWVEHLDSDLPLNDTFSRVKLLRFFNDVWYVSNGLGVFYSSDSITWQTFGNLNVFSNGTAFSPPRGLAVSPFGEYWLAVGFATQLGPVKGAFSQFSYDGGKTWQPQTSNVTFADPNAVGFSAGNSVAYGAGQFLVVGGVESSALADVKNTMVVAIDPQIVKGLGTNWFFDSRPGMPHRASKVVYSERDSRFVVCGSKGNQVGGASLIHSSNPQANDFVAGTNGDSIGMFDYDCTALATALDAPALASGSGTFQQTTTLPVQSSLVVQMLTIANGDLKAGGNLTFPSTSVYRSTGALYCSGTTSVSSGASVGVGTGVVAFPASILEISITSLPMGTVSFTMPLFNYSFFVSAFPMVRLVNAFDTCTALSAPSVSYGLTSASALITVDASSCSASGALSTGAIVGIAVGAAVGGAILAVGIVVLAKYLLRSRDAAANAAIKQQEISHMKEMVRIKLEFN